MLIKIGTEATPALVTLIYATPSNSNTTALVINQGDGEDRHHVEVPFNVVEQLVHDCQKGGPMVNLTEENCARLNPPVNAAGVKKNFNGPAT